MKIASKIFLFSLLVLLIGGWGGTKGKELKPQNGTITIPVKDVDDGKAHYFYTKVNGNTIRYFLLKSDDGVIRAAFDACDVCYRSKKGYSQQGNFMVCNNCGMRFHSRKINEVQGGCNPAPLVRTLENNNVYIKTSDLAGGAGFF